MRWSNDSHLAPTILLHLSPPPGPSRQLQCLLLLVICLLSHLPSVVSASVSARDQGRQGNTPTTECGTQFTDVASSALLADVVLEGRVRQKISPQGDGAPAPGGRYNVSIQVRKQVWKGRELVNQGRKIRKLLVGTFLSSPAQDSAVVVRDDNVPDSVVGAGVDVVEEEGGEGDCVADVTEGATYIFFLRDVGHKKGRYFHISAVPVKKNRRVSRTVHKILKANAAKKPSIQRLKGPRAVKAGASLTLRCKAKAKPNPIFTWFKDGEEITSRRGLRIKNNKRGSRLKISKADKAVAGVYTCQAANAMGEASKNITIKVRGSKLSRQSYNFYEFVNQGANGKHLVSVTTPELIHVACQKQTYCFNGGTCRYIPALHQSFCQCPKQWAGHRCEILDLYGPGNKDKTREAKLEFERVLIIVGIVIALLVFVVICIASYFLANRRRKRWEARRRMKQRSGPESDLLLDKTDGARLTNFTPSYRPLAQKETQTDFNFHPPAYPPKPDPEAKPNLPHTCPNNSSNNILLHDGFFPPLTRTTAATVATAPPPPPQSTNSSQKPARPMSNIESRDLERNGLRSRLKAVSVNENCSDRPVSWKGMGPVPDSQSMPIILDSEGDVPEVVEMNRLSSQPSSTSSPGLTRRDEVDGLSHIPNTQPSLQQPVLPDMVVDIPAQGDAEGCFNPLEDGEVSDDSAPSPPGRDSLDFKALPGELKKSDPEEMETKKALPINGIVDNWESDDEALDKPLLPLHISEEDLIRNAPRMDSFDLGNPSPPLPPPPEPFATDPASPSLSSPSPEGSVPVVPRPTDLGPRPGSMSEDDSAGFLPHTFSSTEASSPLTEGTPQCETYAFDPCIDSDPDDLDEQFMHGSPKKGTGCYRGAEDKDYERRLRNVCADQDAIPI